jgi:hypothetical protein
MHLENVPTPVERSRSDRELVEEILALVRDAARRAAQDPFAYPGKSESIAINLQLFYPERGTLQMLGYQASESVSSLLDKVYFLLNEIERIPMFQYGTLWVLQDEVRGTRYDDIGLEYCQTRGQIRDSRSLESVGIRPGDRLAVIPLRTEQTGAH